MNEDKASRYHRLKRRCAVLLVAAPALLLGALLLSGGSVALREVASAAVGGRRLATVAVLAVLLALVHEALRLPIAAYSGFILERQYGLSSQTAAAWLRDRGKALLLDLVLGVAAAEVVYYALDRWPSWWWLVSALVFMAATSGLAMAAPIVLLPMFYRFTPLGRESLHDRLVALSAKAGVPVLGVYEWGLSARTRRANAALVGAGGTRRILVSDTLLAEYSDDEIEVILAHELGHHVHRDIVTSLLVEFVLLVASFGSASLALRFAGAFAGLQSPSDLAGLPLLLLAAGITIVVATPLVNALSRRHERRADRYALDLTRRPAAFVSAMRRLAAQNLAEERPSTFTLWLFHTHPSIEQRIEAARAHTRAA